MSELVFAAPPILGKSPMQAEVERLSQARLDQDRADADRQKRLNLETQPYEKHAGIVAECRKAHETAMAQHQARLAWFDEHVMGRKPEKHVRLPDTPAPQFCAEQPIQAPAPKTVDQEANLVKHASYWFARHKDEIEAAANGCKRQKRVRSISWYGPDGLRECYIEKLCRAAAIADGIKFDF